MDLRTYLRDNGITQDELGRRVGVTQASVAHWLAGRVRIPAERCGAIERATGGVVTRADLRPDLFGDGTEQAA